MTASEYPHTSKRFSLFVDQQPTFSTRWTAASATQSRSNPVSGRGLPKTGIFQISAGDYRRFRSRSVQFRSPETDSQFAKARHWRAFLRVQRVKSPGAGLVGWSERIRTRAFPIEPGLCVSFPEFGNMAGGVRGGAFARHFMLCKRESSGFCSSIR